MMTETKVAECIEVGKKVLKAEAEALREIGERIGADFMKAVNVILSHKGKVVLTGMGKSGHVAQKIASTFCSVGIPAVYLHPGEAVHGDLGLYSPGDPTIMLSKSGSTSELMRLIPTMRQFNSPIVAIVSNLDSPIGHKADVVLDACVSSEADPLGIVPTSSAIGAMAMGDALASAMMHARGFDVKDFAQLHPGGQLGRNLLMNVGEVMHRIEKIAMVGESASLSDVVEGMTDCPYGAACVVDAQGLLLGIITDGDIRRLLLNPESLSSATAGMIMAKDPIHLTPNALLADAVTLMEEREKQISVLPVVDEKMRLEGLIRIHDIYQPQH